IQWPDQQDEQQQEQRHPTERDHWDVVEHLQLTLEVRAEVLPAGILVPDHAAPPRLRLAPRAGHTGAVVLARLGDVRRDEQLELLPELLLSFPRGQLAGVEVEARQHDPAETARGLHENRSDALLAGDDVRARSGLRTRLEPGHLDLAERILALR